jgi:hypothetical protein
VSVVYVCIGNSDNKLTQEYWAGYVTEVREQIRSMAAVVHGEWYSAPDSGYQNACFCFVPKDGVRDLTKSYLRTLRGHYDQDAVAWAEASATEML